MTETTKISAQIRVDDYNRFAEMAEHHGYSISRLLRLLVESINSGQLTVTELLERRG